MKTLLKRINRIGLSLLAALLTVSLAIAALPLNAVQASGTNLNTLPLLESTPPPTGGQAWGSGLLEKALEREQKINENLVKVLDKADKVATRLEETIATGQEEKRDVSALENALKELKKQLSAVRVAHDQAAGLLAQPAGFNRGGAVTDRQLALKTVREIHQVQQDARQQIGNSIKDTLNAVREYRRNNPAD
jgi:small-conductance mechanosensitive channel